VFEQNVGLKISVMWFRSYAAVGVLQNWSCETLRLHLHHQFIEHSHVRKHVEK
jgi:hypothetical protein